jgi:hypothetical protein
MRISKKRDTFLANFTADLRMNSTCQKICYTDLFRYMLFEVSKTSS